MHSFVRKLITEWRRLDLPFKNEKILIAVSGGADSASLALALNKLYELKKLKSEFIIAHFNHQLRSAESNKDEKFVKKLAEKLDFQFISGKPNLKLKDQKGNLEQLARNARYDFFYKTAVEINASYVLTAHTLNDQAETFLLNLLRGSGIEGLSAMRQKRILELSSQNDDFAEISNSDEKFAVKLIRPLMNWAKREETENFCRENNVKFRQDAMNKDIRFSRVRIRKELIPLLKTFNPKIIETLSTTANLLKNDAELLVIANPKVSEKISLNELKVMPKSLRLRSLRTWLKLCRKDLRGINAVHLEAIDNLILSKKSGRVVELPSKEKVIKKQGMLSFELNKVEKRRLAN